MSAAAVLLQLLFALLAFLLSLPGIFVFLLGVVLFLGLPIVTRITGEFRKFARLHLWLATSMLGRMAIVVSEHGDLLWKNMEFDDLGVEKISFGDETKEFEDPDAALHYWMNIPFAMADEVHGVLFDPRHAALGTRKQAAKERGEYTIDATQDEWDNYTVHKWKKGTFEFPKGVHELVDLTGVRHLVDGGERAEYPERVEAIYKLSRDPFKSAPSATRLIMIIAALCVPFGLLWFLASQGGGGGGGGSTVGYGTGVLLAFASRESMRERLSGVVAACKRAAARLTSGAGSAGGRAGDTAEAIDWKRAAIVAGVLLPLPVAFLLVFVFVSPLRAVLAFTVLGMGFWALPALTLVVKPVNSLAGGYARILLKLGFIGYEKPVFKWTPEKYVLHEYSELESTDDVTWYGLSGSLVGFTFAPSPESWGAEVIDGGDLQNKTGVTDGGEDVETNIPADHRPCPAMKRGHTYAGYIPERFKRGKYYLNSGIATGRFSGSAVGEKSLSRLLWAKEEHGGDSSMSDRSLVYAMLGSGALSLILGVVVFFL